MLFTLLISDGNRNMTRSILGNFIDSIELNKSVTNYEILLPHQQQRYFSVIRRRMNRDLILSRRKLVNTLLFNSLGLIQMRVNRDVYTMELINPRWNYN